MQTTCSNCAAPMGCGAQEKSCWCQQVPTLPPSAYQTGAGCLCAACLQTQLDAGVVLYGIASCDTVKKARAFLTENAVAFAFWDYKKYGAPAEKLALWLGVLGWETLVNRRGTTWRGLSDAEKNAVIDNASAHGALMNYPSLIKRPIVVWGNAHTQALTVGFDAAAWGGLIKI